MKWFFSLKIVMEDWENYDSDVRNLCYDVNNKY